jgi:hypothetical protein
VSVVQKEEEGEKGETDAEGKRGQQQEPNTEL